MYSELKFIAGVEDSKILPLDWGYRIWLEFMRRFTSSSLDQAISMTKVVEGI